jgi:hypothetical protein
MSTGIPGKAGMKKLPPFLRAKGKKAPMGSAGESAAPAPAMKMPKKKKEKSAPMPPMMGGGY